MSNDLMIRMDDLALNRAAIANQILGSRYDFSPENPFVLRTRGARRSLYVCGVLLDEWKVWDLDGVTRAFSRIDAVSEVLWQLRRYGYLQLCGFHTDNQNMDCSYDDEMRNGYADVCSTYPLDLVEGNGEWKGVGMSFKFETVLKGYEYRNQRSGTSQTSGKRWLSLVMENVKDGTQLDVSVPNDLIRDIEDIGLRKGDILDMPVMAVSARDYSYVRLIDLPTVYDEDGEVLA